MIMFVAKYRLAKLLCRRISLWNANKLHHCACRFSHRRELICTSLRIKSENIRGAVEVDRPGWRRLECPHWTTPMSRRRLRQYPALAACTSPAHISRISTPVTETTGDYKQITNHTLLSIDFGHRNELCFWYSRIRFTSIVRSYKLAA